MYRVGMAIEIFMQAMGVGGVAGIWIGAIEAAIEGVVVAGAEGE